MLYTTFYATTKCNDALEKQNTLMENKTNNLTQQTKKFTTTIENKLLPIQVKTYATYCLICLSRHKEQDDSNRFETKLST